MKHIKIKIITENERRRLKTISIPGEIIGDWGTHKTPAGKNLFLNTYGVTHVPTGLGTGAEGMNRKEATQLAIYLNSNSKLKWTGRPRNRKRFRSYIKKLIQKFHN